MLVFVATMFALFASDFKLLYVPIDYDGIFIVITCLSMAIFTLEIILTSILQKEYFNSFYFWLDVISTVSLISDI